MAIKQTPWAVLLCRFKDTDAVNIPLDKTNKLFTTAGAGTYNTLRFFNDYSHGLLDLNGSQVFPQSPKYITVDAALNDYVAPTDPPPPGWQATITRDQLAKKAYDAAKNAGVPVGKFYGIVMIFNAAVGIAWGGSSSVGPVVGADYRYVTESGVTTFGQEMGHGYGLGHSRRDGQLTEYGDPWDVMSTAAFPWTIGKDPDFGVHGPGLNAANMRAQGWIDTNRVWRGLPAGFCEVVQLRPLHRRDLPGPLAAEVPGFPGFIVEYRSKADWDSGIPRSVVLVHRFEGGHSYLMSNTNGDPDMGAGDAFDPFHDASRFLGKPRVDVLSIDDNSQTATLRLCFTPGESIPGDWHGIFHSVIGQVAAGGSGLVWDGHRFAPVPPWNPMAQMLHPMATFITADDVGDPLLRDAVRRRALEGMRELIDAAMRDLDPIQVPVPLRIEAPPHRNSPSRHRAEEAGSTEET